MKKNKPNKAVDEVILAQETGELFFTVSTYLDLLNEGLSQFQAKIHGEVSSFDTRNGHVYFTLKDQDDGSVISCIIWRSSYAACGLNLEIGMEITAFGRPNLYKPTGRFSFIAQTVELVGEGALKQAYEKLKSKLEKEGIFAQESKRQLLPYPERIGLITSQGGAVIHDFLNNLGRFGYKIKFLDSRVEGQLAISELLSAIKFFKKEDIDVLVIIRGGGSLESLQAFNNEMLVREIKKFPRPVAVGIGHDQDVPLAALAADISCSTPTAVTRILNESWESALTETQISERDIFNFFEHYLSSKRQSIENSSVSIRDGYAKILNQVSELEYGLKNAFNGLARQLEIQTRKVKECQEGLVSGFYLASRLLKEKFNHLEQLIALGDPGRQLKLGYSIITRNAKVVRGIGGLKVGDHLNIKLGDGEVESEIKSIK